MNIKYKLNKKNMEKIEGIDLFRDLISKSSIGPYEYLYNWANNNVEVLDNYKNDEHEGLIYFLTGLHKIIGEFDYNYDIIDDTIDNLYKYVSEYMKIDYEGYLYFLNNIGEDRTLDFPEINILGYIWPYIYNSKSKKWIKASELGDGNRPIKILSLQISIVRDGTLKINMFDNKEGHHITYKINKNNPEKIVKTQNITYSKRLQINFRNKIEKQKWDAEGWGNTNEYKKNDIIDITKRPNGSFVYYVVNLLLGSDILDKQKDSALLAESSRYYGEIGSFLEFFSIIIEREVTPRENEMIIEAQQYWIDNTIDDSNMEDNESLGFRDFIINNFEDIFEGMEQ